VTTVSEVTGSDWSDYWTENLFYSATQKEKMENMQLPKAMLAEMNANMQSMLEKMDATQEKMDDNQTKTKANQAKADVNTKEMLARTDANTKQR
jgi:hypothetical protein